MKRSTTALAALLTLALSACSLETVFDPPPKGELKPVLDYREIVAASATATIMRSNGSGLLEVSGLKRTAGPQPGDWVTCLRAMQRGQPTYMAVFFRDNVIVESRGGVIIDGCELETYTPLPELAPALPEPPPPSAPAPR